MDHQHNNWLTFALIAVISWIEPAHASQSTAEKLDADKLRHILDGIEPWPDENTNYSAKNWDGLIAGAELVERSEPQSVKSFFRKYQCSIMSFLTSTNLQEIERQIKKHPVKVADLQESEARDGKLFLLLRVVFDLPEHAGNEKLGFVHAFGGWITYNSERNKDGSVNVAWPITLSNGIPRLVSCNLGYQGFTYDPGGEFDYFLSSYKMRDLRALSAQQKESPH